MYTYTNKDTGYDYVKATPQEINTILGYVTKDLDRSSLNDNQPNEDEDIAKND